MTNRFNQYFGKAGHLAVMSEFQIRGWNIAIPEVDIGDDIFVVQDDSGTLRRVQVKTSIGTKRKDGYSGQFNLSVSNLYNIRNILVHYVFILRIDNKWSSPIIIRQDYLLDYFERKQNDSLLGNNIILYFSITTDKVICGGIDFSNYVNDYTDFPQIVK